MYVISNLLKTFIFIFKKVLGGFRIGMTDILVEGEWCGCQRKQKLITLTGGPGNLITSTLKTVPPYNLIIRLNGMTHHAPWNITLFVKRSKFYQQCDLQFKQFNGFACICLYNYDFVSMNHLSSLRLYRSSHGEKNVIGWVAH